MGYTTIKLKPDVKRALARLKTHRRESYEQVIRRLLSKSRPLSLSRLLVKAYHYLRARGIENIRVFGSRIRGDESAESDLDLLVDLPRSMNLLDVVKMEQELSELLGVKVDLVPSSALDPLLRERVLKEARDVLEVMRE